MCKPINFVVAELEMRDIKLLYQSLMKTLILKADYKVINQNS